MASALQIPTERIVVNAIPVEVYTEVSEAETTISVTEQEIVLTAEESVVTLEVNIGGDSNDKHIRHVQATPSASWVVGHNLNKYPAVSVVDSAKTKIYGDVNYNDANTVTITFSAAFAGEAYFN